MHITVNVISGNIDKIINLLKDVVNFKFSRRKTYKIHLLNSDDKDKCRMRRCHGVNQFHAKRFQSIDYSVLARQWGAARNRYRPVASHSRAKTIRLYLLL